MDWLEIIKVVGSAAGFAALVTAIFNFVSLRAQHSRFLDIESFKQNVAIELFRYTKIYEVLTEIHDYPGIDFQDLERVFSESGLRYQKLRSIYVRVEPLLEPASTKGTRELAEQETALYQKLLEHTYAEGPAVPKKEILLKRLQVAASMVETLSSNLAALTIRSSGTGQKRPAP